MKKSSNPKTPIDIKTGKPNAKPSAKPKRPKKHKLQPGQHPAEVTPVFSEQQKRVLDLLATGCSMAAAAEAVSYTHWALQKWMQRDEVFHYYADRARGIHTSDIYDAFHEVETDARVLLQEIIRDHDVAPHIRLRAALAALNRKDDAWLPRPIHVGAPLVPPQGAEPNLDGEFESNDDRLDQKRGEQSDAAKTEAQSSGWAHTATSRKSHTENDTTLIQRASGKQSDAGQTETEPSGWAHTETSRTSNTKNHTTLIEPASREQSDAAQSRSSGQMKVAGVRSEQNERRPPEKSASVARPSQPPPAQDAPGPTLAVPSKQPDETDTRHLAPDTSAKRDEASQQPDETDTRHLAPDTSAKRGEALRLGHHADRTAPHADRTRSAHLTANQSLPPQTADFRPPEISANADKTPPSNAEAEAQSSGWAHTENSRNSNADSAIIDRPSGKQSDAAQSPQGASNANPGRNEPSEQQPGNNQPSEARPSQPPLTQNTPGPAVAAPIQAPAQTDTRHLAPDTSAKRDAAMRLDTAFFSKYTVLRHENPKDFAHLLAELTSIYEPQAQAEELQVLRMAQAHWNLRRIDTMQTAVLDSTVDQIRSIIPDAHPAAAIASKFLGKDPSDQVWFLDRMHHYRKFHDEYLDRQENRLFRLQERRAYDPIRQARLAALLPQRLKIGPFQTRQARLTHLADRAFQNRLTSSDAQFEHIRGEDRCQTIPR